MNANTNVPAWACPYCEINTGSRSALEMHLGSAHQLVNKRSYYADTMGPNPVWRDDAVFDEPESPTVEEDPRPSFEVIFAGIFDEAFDLLMERQHKYGPENIEGQGIYGVFTRMRDDKMSRLARSMQGTVHNGVVTVDISGNVDDADTFEDACIDIANYALIMLALYRGLWGAPLEEEYDSTGEDDD